MKNKELSPKQQELVDLMKKDWQLAMHRGFTNWCSIQKGKQGHGGEAKYPSIATVWALIKKGIIEEDKETPSTTTYKLKESSKGSQ